MTAFACVLVLAVVGTASPVTAQVASPCDSLLVQADEHYVVRDFDRAENYLRQCLAQPGLSDANAIQAYRLLALVLLRQDELAAAREAVIRLLSVSFAYEPDPVQDPPVYVAFVASIKDQLRVDVPPIAVADAEPITRDAETIEPEEEPDQRVFRVPPPPQEPPPVVERVPERAEFIPRRWLVIGGGAALAVLAGVVLATGGSGDPGPPGPLPTPPPLP